MSTRNFWIGALVGIVVSILFGLLVLPFLGIVEMTATGEPGVLDWWGNTNWQASLKWRAPESQIPSSADVRQGLEHYRSMCVVCHGAPTTSRAHWAHQMQPMPPKLWEEDTQSLADGELFHIIRGGVRMTGMPAFGLDHSSDDIWNMVAFVRELNNLTEEQRQKLNEGSADHGHQHGGEQKKDHHD